MNGFLGNSNSGPMNSDKFTSLPHLSFSNRRVRWRPFLKTSTKLLRINKTTQKYIFILYSQQAYFSHFAACTSESLHNTHSFSAEPD